MSRRKTVSIASNIIEEHYHYTATMKSGQFGLLEGYSIDRGASAGQRNAIVGLKAPILLFVSRQKPSAGSIEFLT